MTDLLFYNKYLCSRLGMETNFMKYLISNLLLFILLAQSAFADGRVIDTSKVRRVDFGSKKPAEPQVQDEEQEPAEEQEQDEEGNFIYENPVAVTAAALVAAIAAGVAIKSRKADVAGVSAGSDSDDVDGPDDGKPKPKHNKKGRRGASPAPRGARAATDHSEIAVATPARGRTGGRATRRRVRASTPRRETRATRAATEERQRRLGIGVHGVGGGGSQ